MRILVKRRKALWRIGIILLVLVLVSAGYTAWHFYQTELKEQEVRSWLVDYFYGEPEVSEQAAMHLTQLGLDGPYAQQELVWLKQAQQAVTRQEPALALEKLALVYERGRSDSLKAIAAARAVRLYLAERKVEEAKALLNRYYDWLPTGAWLELHGDILRVSGEIAKAKAEYRMAQRHLLSREGHQRLFLKLVETENR